MPDETPELKSSENTPAVETPAAVETTTPEITPDSDSPATDTSDAPSKSDFVPKFSDYLARKQGADIVEKPKVEKPTAEPTRPGPVEKLPTSAPKETPPVKPFVSKTKDLTGIDDMDRIYFRDMSNDAFAYHKKVYLANKEREGKLKELETKLSTQPAPVSSYTGHPEAYKLSESYTRTLQSHTIADAAERHLQQQLINIAEGKQWEGLTTDAQGNICRTGKLEEPTEAARLHLESQLRRASDIKFGYEKQLQTAGEAYKQKYDADVAQIRAAEQKFFPGYEKPEHPTAAAQKEIIKMLPESMRSDTLAPLMAMSVTTNLILEKQNQEKDKKIAELESQIKALNGKAAMPSKGNTNSPVSGDTHQNGDITEIGDRKIMSFDAMRRARQGVF